MESHLIDYKNKYKLLSKKGLRKEKLPDLQDRYKSFQEYLSSEYNISAGVMGDGLNLMTKASIIEGLKGFQNIREEKEKELQKNQLRDKSVTNNNENDLNISEDNTNILLFNSNNEVLEPKVLQINTAIDNDIIDSIPKVFDYGALPSDIVDSYKDQKKDDLLTNVPTLPEIKQITNDDVNEAKTLEVKVNTQAIENQTVVINNSNQENNDNNAQPEQSDINDKEQNNLDNVSQVNSSKGKELMPTNIGNEIIINNSGNTDNNQTPEKDNITAITTTSTQEKKKELGEEMNNIDKDNDDISSSLKSFGNNKSVSDEMDDSPSNNLIEDYSKLNEKLNESCNKNALLQQENADLQKRLDDLYNASINNNFPGRIQELNDTVLSLENNLHSLVLIGQGNTNNTSLQTEIDNLNQERKKLLEECLNFRNLLSQFQRENSILGQINQQLRNDNTKLQKLQQNLIDLTAKIKQLEDTNNNQRTKINEQNIHLNAKDEALNNLHQILAQVQQPLTPLPQVDVPGAPVVQNPPQSTITTNTIYPKWPFVIGTAGCGCGVYALLFRNLVPVEYIGHFIQERFNQQFSAEAILICVDISAVLGILALSAGVVYIVNEIVPELFVQQVTTIVNGINDAQQNNINNGQQQL